MYLDDPHLQPPRPRGPFPGTGKARSRHGIAQESYLETQRRNRARLRADRASCGATIKRAKASWRGAASGFAGFRAWLAARLAR